MTIRTVSKCARTSPDQSKWKRHLSLETLEDRRQLSANPPITNVVLINDTGASNTDRYTSNPAITGNFAPTVGYGVQVMDNNGVIGTATLSNGKFTYDPLAFDSALQNWEGALDLQYRAVQYNSYGGIINAFSWGNFNLILDRVAPSTNGIADTLVERKRVRLRVST